MTKQLQQETNAKQCPPIPSRDEFHRNFAGLIYAADFNTNYPNPYRNLGNSSTCNCAPAAQLAANKAK